MIGLRRKNILTYLNPDDHMMDMWQKDYVLQVDNWKKQWSGCSKTLTITARSSINRTAVAPRPPKRSGFTSTPVPRFSGKSNWEQYRHVFEAIVHSNGWDDVTTTLQLLSHLDGDALNVALLVPESQRVLPGLLVKSLSDDYSSPGRLAEYKRQFQRAFRRPGDDPSIFARN